MVNTAQEWSSSLSELLSDGTPWGKGITVGIQLEGKVYSSVITNIYRGIATTKTNNETHSRRKTETSTRKEIIFRENNDSNGDIRQRNGIICLMTRAVPWNDKRDYNSAKAVSEDDRKLNWIRVDILFELVDSVSRDWEVSHVLSKADTENWYTDFA